MNNDQKEMLKNSLNIELSEDKLDIFVKYANIFLEKNSHTNLISKNDAKLLFEKHIFDSLAINKFFENKKSDKLERLLDIGAGGGFPSVPLAILYNKLNIFALDSIKKKIKIIDEIKTELDLKNLYTICDRAENLQLKNNNNAKFYDYVTTRAVAPLEVILKYSMVNLKHGGYFIAYKSKKALSEIKDAERVIKSLNAKMVEIIEYTLPLEEIHERNLIIFQKG